MSKSKKDPKPSTDERPVAKTAAPRPEPSEVASSALETLKDLCKPGTPQKPKDDNVRLQAAQAILHFERGY